jgi:hypothetical protein
MGRRIAMYAVAKIKMNDGHKQSNDLLDIDQLYLDGKGSLAGTWHTKAYLYDYLKINPGSIQISIDPKPFIMPMLSDKGEKYIKSSVDLKKKDYLLSLPRE